MNESTLRTWLGPELAEASDVDLRGTIGLPSATEPDATADVDPDAPTLVLDESMRAADGDAGDAEDGAVLAETGYELIEEVGRGGMNVVFRARQLGLERDVAVKRLRSKRRASRTARWSFLSEAVVTSQLDHPNVMPIYGLSVDHAGEVALAMKLMRGKSWAHRLREDFAQHDPADPPPRLQENLRILLGVTNAVAFAHSRGVLHRDLKPENVMIGEFGEVLVLDWGLAVRFTDDEDGVRAPHRSSVRRMAGTPVYMAPEMVEARGDALGPWTDVYLLGGLLHEILVGRPPHGGTKLVDVLLAAYESEPPSFPKAVPVELQEACRRALAREPAARFASAPDLAAAVEAYLAHRESLEICERAAARLALCRETVRRGVDAENRGRLYSDLREVIAGFAAARDVWSSNAVAAQGEAEARMLLARSALSMGEFGTAESALRDQKSDEALALSAQIREAIAARENTLRATRRMSVALLVLQLGIATLLGLWGRHELRQYHYEVEVAELRRLTPLAAMAIRATRATTDPEKLRPLVDRIVRDLSSEGPIRLSVIDPDGRVLADSSRDPGELASHVERPELEEAARSGAGTATRWSDTLQEEMVYFAMPIRSSEGKPLAFVRAALPLDFVTQELRGLVAAVGVAFVLSVVAMSLVTMILTRHLTRAIERLH